MLHQHTNSQSSATPEPILVIACGALARELLALKRLNHWGHMQLQCLDASLHNRPAAIPGLLREKIRRARPRFRRIFIAYADCGTGGEIDRIIEQEDNVERLPGAHCYQIFAGAEKFAQLSDEEPGTFYLTDFLVRSFDRLIVQTLKLDQYPQLLDEFFGNYRRVVYISQTRDPQLLAAARAAARYLGLEFQHLHNGYGELETSLTLQMVS